MKFPKTFKENIAKILNEAGFRIHKCHSNIAELEEEDDVSLIETDETYAHQGRYKNNNTWDFLEQAR